MTFNAPNIAGDYSFISWASDESGSTACGGPVGMSLTVLP